MSKYFLSYILILLFCFESKSQLLKEYESTGFKKADSLSITWLPTYNMCSSTSSDSTEGYLYDSGGPGGNYSNNENCVFTIDVSCADYITLTAAISYIYGYDTLKVFDGPTIASPLIYNFNYGGNYQIQIVSSGSAITIQFTSNTTAVQKGFEIHWVAHDIALSAPQAGFLVDSNPPIKIPVLFTDTSTNISFNSYWDFGDSTTSTLRNSKHTYKLPGYYTIKHIVQNCFGSDTATQNITVQNQPIISVNPTSLNVNISCYDSLTLPVVVRNTGSGDLVFNGITASEDSLPVLALTYGVVINNLNKTVNAIKQYYNHFAITYINTVDTFVFRNALKGKKVLLLCDPQNVSISNFTKLGTIIQDFANQGGWVLMLGSSHSLYWVKAGLMSGTLISTFQNQTVNNIEIYSPLTQGVPSAFLSPQNSFAYSMTDSGFIPVLTYSNANYVVAGYRNLGKGKIILIGFDYKSAKTSTKRLAANAFEWAATDYNPGWLSCDNATQIVPPGDSTQLNIHFNPHNLSSGIYINPVTLFFNRIGINTLSIPCTLTVTGTAILNLSDTFIDFGNVYNNFPFQKSFTISNTGCDTIFISNIVSSNSWYTMSDTSLKILPYSNKEILVTINASAAGLFSDSLIIHSNLPDTTIQLSANVIIPPTLSVTQNVEVTLSCNDSITIPVTIKNLGQDTLHLNIPVDTNYQVEILALTYGVDLLHEYANTINSIAQKFSSYHLTTLNDTSVKALQLALRGKHLLLIPKQEFSDPTVFTAYAPVLQSFAAEGGWVFFCGSSYSMNNCMFNTGLLHGNYVSTYGNCTVNLINPLSPLTYQIPNYFSVPFNATYYSITDINFTDVIIYTGYPVVGFRDIGFGRVILFGFDFSSIDVNTSQLIGNAMHWARDYSLTDWLKKGTYPAAVLPGDSVQINLTFSSSNLNAGTHTTGLVIISNDPFHPVTYVPCTLHVTGIAEIKLSENCLLFDSTFVGEVKHDSISINNAGCDTLQIISITTGAQLFNATVSKSKIEPHSNAYIYVTYSPVSVGSFIDTIYLQTNVGDTSICLVGIATLGPDGSFYPNTLNALLACNDSTTVSLTLKNTGIDQLTYSLNEIDLQDSLQVLALTYGLGYSGEYQNSVNAVRNHFKKFVLTEINTQDASVLETALDNKHILLLPEPQSGMPFVYAGMATVFQRFLDRGGWIILCGTSAQNGQNCFATGLISGSYFSKINGDTLTNLLPTCPLMDSVPLSFISPTVTNSLNLNMPGKVMVASCNNADVVTYINHGNGKLIFLGFDYSTTTTATSQIIANAFLWADTAIVRKWIHYQLTDSIISAGDSTVLNFTFSSVGLTGGLYNFSLTLNTNDPPFYKKIIPCSLTVLGVPCPSYNFAYPETCDGTIYFNNTTLMIPTNVYWDFGDGTSSNQMHPDHYFAAAGTYNVKLIACNGYGCDSTFNQVTIGNVTGPYHSNCHGLIPYSVWLSPYYGIIQMQLNTINNSSQTTPSYVDYSCSQSTLLVQGTIDTLTVTTPALYNERVQAWIDYNNNGELENYEKLPSVNSSGQHVIPFTVSPNAVLNVPLRLRVTSNGENNFTSSCGNTATGQIEDYAVVILPNTNPPVAGMQTIVQNNCMGVVFFNDASQNIPSSWKWFFGDGDSSDVKNPVHHYLTNGTFTVTLIVSNAFGSDTVLSILTINQLTPSIQISGIPGIGQIIYFNCPDTNVFNWYWTFGDGNNSNLQSPNHTYLSPGPFTVSLNASDSICNGQADTLLNVPDAINNLPGDLQVSINPNPFNESTEISFELNQQTKLTVSVFDDSGKLVSTLVDDEIVKKGKHILKFSSQNTGVYFVRFISEKSTWNYKLIKMR